jgi:FkbM family methyltransferase
MKAKIKQIIKRLIPFAITRNQKYDRDTKKILKYLLKSNSNTVDVGCHKGEVMMEILKFSPQGKHFGIEPIPFLAADLRKKLPTNCTVFEVALNETGNEELEFVWVKSNPAYSGLKERSYERIEETEKIKVKTARLDELINENLKIDFIKIDVEGGEMGVIKGSEKILIRNKPVIIFEHGLGASDKYGTKPEVLFDYLNNLNYKISTMQLFLKNKIEFSKSEFSDQFYAKKNYYFIAW